jgi:hypothetical protein
VRKCNNIETQLAELRVDMEAAVAMLTGGGGDAWIFPPPTLLSLIFGVVSDGGLGSTDCLFQMQ